MSNGKRLFCPPFIAVALSVFMLSSCAVRQPYSLPPAQGPVEKFIISAEPGQSTTLDEPAFGGNVRVVMDSSFVSANGEECRRATVIAREKEAEVVVICRPDGGYWFMAPRVWGNDRI